MTLQLAILNYLANRPDIIAAMAPGYHDIDMAGFYARPFNVAFGDHRGGVLFAHRTLGVYEIHFMLTPALRGRERFEICRRSIATMFTRHAATNIVGLAPCDNVAVRVMGRALGFVPLRPSVDSLGRPCIEYTLGRAAWAASSAGS